MAATCCCLKKVRMVLYRSTTAGARLAWRRMVDFVARDIEAHGCDVTTAWGGGRWLFTCTRPAGVAWPVRCAAAARGTRVRPIASSQSGSQLSVVVTQMSFALQGCRVAAFGRRSLDSDHHGPGPYPRTRVWAARQGTSLQPLASPRSADYIILGTHSRLLHPSYHPHFVPPAAS